MSIQKFIVVFDNGTTLEMSKAGFTLLAFDGANCGTLEQLDALILAEKIKRKNRMEEPK